MSSFDYEFDKVVYKKKKDKQAKKELFDKNIKEHIVYMDEKGNIKKKPNETDSEGVDKGVLFVGIIFLFVLMALLKR